MPAKFCELFDFLNSLPNYKRKEGEGTEKEGEEKTQKTDKRGGALPTDAAPLAALNTDLAEPWRAEMKEYNGGFAIDEKKCDDDSYGGMELCEEVRSGEERKTGQGARSELRGRGARSEALRISRRLASLFANTILTPLKTPSLQLASLIAAHVPVSVRIPSLRKLYLAIRSIAPLALGKEGLVLNT